MSQPCPYCHSEKPPSEPRTPVISFGQFVRKCDGTRHQRYRCGACARTFSSATLDACYRQKKRHLNSRIFEDYVSGKSQRRLALLLRINRKTLIRRPRSDQMKIRITLPR